MTDPFTWSIDLGRWGATRVRIHLLMLVFLGLSLLSAALAPESHVAQTLAWMVMLIGALALHELGHAAVALRLGEDPDEIRLWPLGNLVLPAPGYLQRSHESFLIALGGLVTSFSLALVCYVALLFGGARMELNPFGNDQFGGGVAWIGDRAAPAFEAPWWIGWFGWLNLVIFLANLIPALPMDGGRIVRSLYTGSPGQSRDGMAAFYFARGSAVVLIVTAVFRLFLGRSGGSVFTLIALAVLIEVMVRYESRMIEEGGYFEEGGLFGYDFSEGYTSLEAGAVVRPRRENALKRWRRRRSELRRQRRLAQVAAEEARMDEILDKLHREGRAALTEEEYRFLVRVSTKYKNKTRSTEG